MSIHDADGDDWRSRAACNAPGVEPEWFFPEPYASPAPALVVCAGCPVRQPCLEAGLLEQHGIFGGLGPRERSRLRVKLGVTRPPSAPTRPAGGPNVLPCGTTSGYFRHKRDREKPCRECLDARAIYRRARRAAKNPDGEVAA